MKNNIIIRGKLNDSADNNYLNGKTCPDARKSSIFGTNCVGKKECKGRVAQWIEPLSHSREDASSKTVRKSRRAHTDLSENQIKKEEKQAHSLNKATVSLTGISHEFLLDSEIAEPHTLSNDKQSEYLNFSEFPHPARKLINKDSILASKNSFILFSILLLTLLSSFAFAIPDTLTLQGKLTNLNGAVQEGTFNFTFKAYDSFTDGNVLWQRINMSVTTDSNGIYDIILKNLSSLNFSEQYYLAIDVNGKGESDPRINLTSSPYSFRANISERLNRENKYEVSVFNVTGNLTLGTDFDDVLAVTTGRLNITEGDIKTAGNLTLAEKITFSFGAIIDNLVSNVLKISGRLNVTGNVSIAQDTLFVDNTSGRVGIGTTAPNYKLEVAGNVSLNSSLFVTSSGNIGIGQTSPNATLGVSGSVNITGNVVLGDSSDDTIAVNARFISNLIPNQNNVDLGSASNFWRRAYIDQASISNLSVTGNTSIGGTNSPTWTLNSNYTGDDALDVELIFERGTPVTNAVFKWDSTNKRFDLNLPLFIQANMNLTVDTNTLFVDGSIDRVGIGTASPINILTVAGDVSAFGSLNATFINATEIRQGVNQVQTINAVFNLANYSTEYASTGFKRGNVTDYIGGDNASLLRTINVSKDLARSFSNFGLANVSNNTLFKGDNATLALWDRGSSTTFLRNTGDNVGIGTTAPATVLDVKGKANFTGNFSVGQTSNIFFVDNTSGYVGIGTTGPSTTLDVAGNARILQTADAAILTISRNSATNVVAADATGDSIRLTNPNTGTNIASGISIRDSSSNQFGAGIFFVQTDQTSADEQFYTSFWTSNSGNSGAGERMRITEAGNVGIGTTTPDNILTILGNEITSNAILHINASDNYNTSVVNVLTLDHILKNPVNSTGGVGLSILFRATDNASQLEDLANISAVLYNATNGTELSALTFSTRGADTIDDLSGNLRERLRIDGFGRVGINDTTPSGALDVDTSSADTLVVTSGKVGIGTATPTVQLEVRGGVNISAGLNVTSGDVLLATTSGSVGIGTASPNTKLEINGTTTIGGDVNIPSNNLNVGGGYSAGGVSLIGTGADKGSGQFGRNILLDGDIISVYDVEVNQSFLPKLDLFSILGNRTQRFLDLFVANIRAGNRTLNITGNVSIGGDAIFVDNTSGRVGIGTASPTQLLDVDGNADLGATSGTLYVDSSNARVGIGLTAPNDALEVVGNLRVSGGINATSINATSINVTSLILGWTNLTSYPSACSAGQFVTQVGDTLTCSTPTPASGGGWTDDGTVVRLATATDSVGIGTTTPDNILTILGNEITSNAILHINASDNYNTSVVNVLTLDHILKTLNSTGGAGVSILFRATDNASQLEDLANISAVLYNATNGTELSALTFSTRGSDTTDDLSGNLRERLRIDGSGRVGIGTATPFNTLTIIGDVSAFGSLNATFINATEVRQGLNQVQTINAVFNLANYSTEYAATGFKIANYSAEYASTGFKRANVTDYLGEDGNASLLRTVNVSKDLARSFSNFLLANVSNNTLVKGDNATLALWDRGSSTTFLRNTGDSVGIGTATPDNKLTIRGTDADSYLDVPSILHLNITDSQNTTITNFITLDHLLNNPENATNTKAGAMGGIGLGILFRAINNDSEIINVSFINATLVDARNGSEAGALTFYTANRSNKEARLVPKLILNGTDVFIAPTGGKVGIGTASPINALTVIGDVSTFGSLNATFINATEIRQGVNQVQTINAVFNLANYSTEYAATGFKIANYSAEYASTGFKRGNASEYLGGADVNASIIKIGNVSKLFEENYSKEYAATGFKIANYSTEYAATGFKRGNVTDYLGEDGNASLLRTVNVSKDLARSFSNFGLANVSNNTLFKGDNATLALWNRGSSTTFLRNTGDSVGIGTATPDNKLTIRGTDADSYLDVPSILHLNITDSQNTTTTNFITLDHLLNNPENATNTKAGAMGGIGLGILFRAINNDSEIINVSFINATLVDARNGTEIGALTFYTANKSGSNSRLVPRLILNGSDVFIAPTGVGRVGIGTASPTFKLEVVGTTKLDLGVNDIEFPLQRSTFVASDHSQIYTSLADGGSAQTAFGQAGNLILQPRTSDSVGQIVFATGTAAAARMFVNAAGVVNIGYVAGETVSGALVVNGNVGIGQASPKGVLEVEGNVNISGGLNVTAGDVLLATSSGNVGIGTTSPGDLLELSAASGNNVNLTGGEVNNNNFLIKSGGSMSFIMDSNNDQTAREFNFYNDSQATVNALMTILDSGRVGIGVTAGMNSSLQIADATARTQIGGSGIVTVADGGGGGAIGDRLEINFKDWLSYDNSHATIGYITTSSTSNYNGDIYFATKSDTTTAFPTEKMRITAAGNVGIGTTSPTKALHVIGSANFTGTIYYGGNLTGYGADFAEMMHSDEILEAGDVVCFVDASKVEKCRRDGDKSVAGVVSSNPTIIGNAKAGRYPIGIVGLVKSNVLGPVEKFDLLTTSAYPGYAKIATIHDFGAVLGKSLESCEEETCAVNMLVSLS